jgi:DNA processing protein
MTASGGDIEAACAAALAGLPGMGPAGLVRILSGHPPAQAWEAVCSGRLTRPPVRGRPGATDGRSGPTWADRARRIDPVSWWAPFARQGIGVTWPGRPDFPAALAADPQPPGVLFWKGRLAVLERPCVAVIGTRQATPDGRGVAFEMGRDLVRAGVCVVSGLALGIDGAAHSGAVRAVSEGAPGATVGVAASGVDVPYPHRHQALWGEVTAAGAVISENLPGRPAQAWRFPSRNRVIAGLVQLVVVVESHRCGGSLITAEAAIDRGIEVRVVPGPVHSPASAGSNQLLYDGPGPVRHARDVLDALGIFMSDPAAPDPAPGPTRRPAPPAPGPPPPGPPPPGPRLTGPLAAGPAASVLAAMGWRPVTLGHIMARTGLGAAAVGRELDALAAAGLVRPEGAWWCRAG